MQRTNQAREKNLADGESEMVVKLGKGVTL